MVDLIWESPPELKSINDDDWFTGGDNDIETRWDEVMAESGLQQDTFEDGTPWTQEELNKATAHGMRNLFIGEEK